MATQQERELLAVLKRIAQALERAYPEEDEEPKASTTPTRLVESDDRWRSEWLTIGREHPLLVEAEHRG